MLLNNQQWLHVHDTEELLASTQAVKMAALREGAAEQTRALCLLLKMQPDWKVLQFRSVP